jgi:hypothetical protein
MSSSDTSRAKANSKAEDSPAAGDGIIATARAFIESRDPPRHPFDPLCGNCGYLLTGLQRGSLCPECGTSCPDDEIVLPGWGAGPYENLATAAPSRLWWVALSSLLWLACLWSQVIESFVHHRLAPAAGWTAIIVGAAALFLYRRWKLVTDFGCTAHLRLSPKGLGQRQGFGPLKLTPWASDLKVKLTPRPRSAHLIGAWRLRPGQRSDPKQHHWIIAFEFECSTAQADHLRALVQRWGGQV